MTEYKYQKLTTDTTITTNQQNPNNAGGVDVAKSTPAKPIDYSQAEAQAQKVKQNNEELYTYINSDEFRQLDPEAQAKALKSKFFPTSSDEEVKSQLGVLKETAAQSQLQEKAEKVEKTDNSTNTAEEISETQESQTDVEIAANKYMESIGGKNETIDDLYSKALQTPEEERSPEAQAFLDAVKNEQDTQAQAPKTEQKKSELEEFKQFFSPEWSKKTPEEKVRSIAERYLIETGACKSGKPTKRQINQFLKSINAEMARRKPEGKNALVLELIATLEALKDLNANGKEMSLEDFNRLSPTQKRDITTTYIMKKFNSVAEELLPNKPADWDKKTELEKIQVYADAILKQVDPEYAKMPAGDDKEQYLKNKTDSFIENNILNGWKQLGEATKELMLQDISATKTMLEKANMTYAKFKTLSKEEQQNIENKFKPETSNPVIKLKNDLAKELIKQGVKDRDIPREILKLLEAKKDLTPEEQTLKNALSEMAKNAPGLNPKNWYTSNEQAAQNAGISVEEYINNAIKSNNPNKIQSIINGASDPKERLAILEKLEAAGWTKEALSKLTEEWTLSFDTATAIAQKDHKAMIDIKNVRAKTGTIAAGEKWIPSEYKACTTKEAQQELTECNLKFQEYVKTTTAVMADRTIMSKERAAECMTYALSSEIVPDANKALATTAYINNVSKNGTEETLYAAKNLSTIKNAAVSEGLAAASKNVDKSIRQQYNSYVETSIKNYPPEQQSRIRKALETGKISSETLSQTTVAEKSNKTANTSSAATKPTAPNANAISGASNTASQTGIQTPTNVKSPSVGTPTNFQAVNKTLNQYNSTLSTTMSEKETQELTQKAQAVLDKIENFRQKQAESMADREEELTALSEIPKEEIEDAVQSEAISISGVKLSKDETETLKQTITVLFEKNSISTAYKKLVSKFGNIEEVFLKVFATNANSAALVSFASNFKNDTNIILKLYQYSNDSSLISFLPKDMIRTLLQSGGIPYSTLSSIPQDILYELALDKAKNGTRFEEIKPYFSNLKEENQGAFLAAYPDYKSEVDNEVAENKNTPAKGSHEWLMAQNKQDPNTKINKPEEKPQLVNEFDPEQKTAFIPRENIDLYNNYPTWDDGISIGSTTLSNPRGDKDKYDKRKIKGHRFISKG